MANTQDSATVNSLPDWYMQYGQSVTGAGMNMLPGMTNYQGYVNPDGSPAPRVAGLDPNQQQAYQQAQNMQGQWQPQLDQATGMVNQGAGVINSALPMYDQAAGYIGNAGQYLDQGAGYIGSATGNFDTGQGDIRSATPMFDQAGNTINSATGNFNQAGGSFDAATGQFGNAAGVTNQGTGLIGQGSGALSTAGNILMPGVGNAIAGGGTIMDPNNQANRDAWMNPYTDRVANTIASLADQNLMENVIPNINSTFVGNGQFGSTRNGDFMNHAVRDNQQAVSNAQAQMLLQAQNQADQMYSAEKDRQLNSGQVLGGLSQVGTNIGNAYGNLANANTNIGQTLSNIGTGLTNVGVGRTNLGNAVVNQGSALRQVGDSRVNQGVAEGTIGNDRVNQGSAMTGVANGWTNMGQGMTGAANGKVGAGASLGGLGSNLGALTQMGQQLSMNDINALLTTGGLQQKTNQAGLDAAYEDFLDRRDYPLKGLGALSSVLPNVSGRITPDSYTSSASGATSDPYRNIQDIINIINGKG